VQNNLDIQAVRHAALHLHKVLIEAVRLDYEQAHGRVGHPTHLWQLVLNDQHFAWLRPLSRWLVTLDDEPGLAAAETDEVSPNAVMAAAVGGLDHTAGMRRLERSAAVRGELESLFSDPDWTQPYLQVLQDVPEAVIAHARLQHELQRLPANDASDALLS
jgi:hypothetical protein